MPHPLFWPTVTFFYPVGNTSAVCLTENLSPESKADILLLTCGDPRHILYTIYTNESNPLTSQRTLDITCCDVDAAILARNTLLPTLLADDGVLDKLDNFAVSSSLWRKAQRLGELAHTATFSPHATRQRGSRFGASGLVPRDAIARLERDFKNVSTPELHCDMHDGSRQNWFAVNPATFGSLRVSGTGEHRTGVIVEGNVDAETDAHAMQLPWRTKAPLIITFSVAASSVIDFVRNPMATVALALRPSVGVTANFSDRLGFNLTVFRTQLTNAERVFVLARRPVVGASESTLEGRAQDLVDRGERRRW